MLQHKEVMMPKRLPQSETHIEQVRELMFGPQVREYNQRLDQIESMLVQLREGLRKSFDDLSGSFASQLETAMSSADKKLKALDARTGEERAELQQQVEQLTERLNVRLTQLETDCTTFQDESRKRLDAINDSFTRSLHEAIDAVDKRLQGLATKVQDEGGDLHRQARRTEEKLDGRFQSLSNELESSTTTMRNELTRAQKGLRDELQTLRAQLLDELDKHFRAVQEAKVSKDEMSEVLFEFGMRIKGLEIVTDLPRLPVSGHVDDDR